MIKKIIIVVLLVLVVAGVYRYFGLGFYVGRTVKDSDNTVDRLSSQFQSNLKIEELDREVLNADDLKSCFAKKLPGCPLKLSGYRYSFDNNQWEIMRRATDDSADYYVNWIGSDGKRADKILRSDVGTAINEESDGMYFSYPYLFLQKDVDSVSVYNVQTNKLTTINPSRSFGCSDAHVVRSAYEDGVLYFEQYLDWSFTCNGNFKVKVNLN